MYGEWLWDDMYGYVWRPFIDNGMYPWGWQPYYYGQWAMTGGQMFWVPQEPWGWIPYHLGIWQWDKKHGWVWLPGSMFAPAWATWDFYFGFACWRPWGLYDWMGGYGAYGYGMSGFSCLDGGWIYSPYWNTGPGSPSLPGLAVVRKDQLKPPAATAYPVPSELTGVLKKATAAYEKGDARIRDSANEVPRHLVFVAKGDLKTRAVNEKALTWDQVPKPAAPSAKEPGVVRRLADFQREAARAFHGGETPAVRLQKQEDPAGKTVDGGSFVAVPLAPGRSETPVRRDDAPRAGKNIGGAVAGPGARFRDWNPDVRIARELGVHIEYSSQRNEVRCPELRISSLDRERGSGIVPHLTSQGVSYGPASSVGGGDSGSSGSSETPGASSSSARSSGRSEGKESKGSEGGKIKN